MANVERSIRDEAGTDRKARSLDRPLGDYVQAHLGRASKFADGRTRDWSFFFFFRILSQAEFDAGPKRDAVPTGVLAAGLGLEALSRRRGLRRRREDEEDRVPRSHASAAFRAFLKAAVNRDIEALQRVIAAAEPTPSEGGGLGLMHSFQGASFSGAEVAGQIEALMALVFDGRPSEVAERSLETFARLWAELGLPPETEDMWPVWTILVLNLKLIIRDPVRGATTFDRFAEKPGPAGLGALRGGLIGLCLYETIRKLRPAARERGADGAGKIPAIVRSESAQQKFADHRLALRWDPCPVNFVFTYAGLVALGLDQTTLASFPDAFTQGMAARADRLGDTGPSAPENWDGPLGVNDVNDLASLHGYFTGGFLVGDDTTPVQDTLWRTAREGVAAFNAPSDPKGAALRRVLNDHYRLLGLKVVYIELGEYPYEVTALGNLQRTPYRKEHFGFSDGVSQPFVDLRGILFDPPPGGGTPAPNRTWAPVAPGEIYLSERDEDHAVQTAPVNALLRQGATYAVFRKLEQNVPEFRAYLAKRRPDDAAAQLKLASEFVGRWPNGASLVLAPDRELGFGPRPQGAINDFLYAADDPKGRRCPLGAHARRTNPRDTGGTDEVRRHRILRRSISYGGPLLPPGSIGDGRKRGLLFIALNSRIDLQFELIQSRWINGGEILGQAGLNRCPLTGANRGTPDDAFLEAGAVAPVVELPRFVVTRGGDYFFAPGVDALAEIGDGETFPPDVAVPFDGYSMDDAFTPSLFNPLLDPDRLKGYADLILSRREPVIRVAQPPSDTPIPGDPAGSDVVFVAQYDDVVKVLSLVAPKAPLVYSVAPYREASRRITRGHDLIEGTEPGRGSQTAREHARLHAVLDAAWNLLSTGPAPVYAGIDTLLKESLDLALRRVAKRGLLDLVSDFALASVYEVVAKVFGIPGPDWVTELAIALPFYRQHVGELLPGWLDTVKTPPPPLPSLATLQTWSVAVLFDVVANYEQAQELMAVSDQAAGEFLEYLDALIATVRAEVLTHPIAPPATLVEAFVRNEARFVGRGRAYRTAQEYYWDVATLLMDLAASAIAFIPSVFGFVMQTVLDLGLNLPGLIPILTAPPQYDPTGSADDGIPRLIYETCRLYPPAGILMRTCVRDDVLPSGGVVKRGDFIATMVGAAGMDESAFPDAKTFSLFPFLQGSPRDLNKYLLFGVLPQGRYCWGRDRLARLALTECIKAAGRLQKLRKAPGAAGALRTNLGTNVGIALGLEAKFDSVLPPWP
jgi:Dyp-type peroxidase family